jgi:RPA family protein
MTAKKVKISEIVNGRWEKKEGMVPSFVVTSSGEEVSRARIMGTVVSVFVAEDGNFASLTIDDSTETIRAKTFKTTKPVDSFEVGNMVDLIGKVREYNSEIYIIPEIVTKVDDPNLELLRKLEINKKPKGESKPEVRPGKANDVKTKEKKVEKEEKPKKDDRGELKREILKFIESSNDGVEYGKIIENVKAKEAEIESVVNEILAEGICYEPTPGKIKKI